MPGQTSDFAALHGRLKSTDCLQVSITRCCCAGLCLLQDVANIWRQPASTGGWLLDVCVQHPRLHHTHGPVQVGAQRTGQQLTICACMSTQPMPRCWQGVASGRRSVLVLAAPVPLHALLGMSALTTTTCTQAQNISGASSSGLLHTASKVLALFAASTLQEWHTSGDG